MCLKKYNSDKNVKVFGSIIIKKKTDKNIKSNLTTSEF